MSGTRIGTYKYMAPEVFKGQAYGSTADIYSLGIVLYWLLNDRRMPFVAAQSNPLLDGEAQSRRLSGEPLPPPVHGSAALKQLVLKACAYDPKNRFTTAAEMLHALNQVHPYTPIALYDPANPTDPAANTQDIDLINTTAILSATRVQTTISSFLIATSNWKHWHLKKLLLY